jgi:hypothetical protein
LSSFFSRRQFYLLIERRAPRMIAVFHIFMSVHEMLPNKSPEPTAIGRLSLFHKIRVRRVAVTRWLSFCR